MPNMPCIIPAAYFMGGTLGCGAASNCVNAGAMSPPVKVMKAPLFPIWSLRAGKGEAGTGPGVWVGDVEKERAGSRDKCSEIATQ